MKKVLRRLTQYFNIEHKFALNHACLWQGKLSEGRNLCSLGVWIHALDDSLPKARNTENYLSVCIAKSLLTL